MPKQTELPDGTFFHFREEDESYYPRGSFDPEPEETNAIRSRRKALCLEHGFEWPAHRIGAEDIFTSGAYPGPPLDAESVHRRIGFDRPAPKNKIYHYFQSACLDYATGRNGYHASYRVVSEEWKAAIEDVEPNIHQFFEYELQFTDKTVTRYIFNPRTVFDIRADSSQSIIDVYKPHAVNLSRAAIGNRHWICQFGCRKQFASRELAVKLLPLLPPLAHFVPQFVVG